MDIFELLRIHEGFVSHAYRDSEGYYTIGIGRLIDSRLKGGISLDEAEYLLQNDVTEVQRQLDKHISWWQSESYVRKMALMDMAFNLGINKLLKFKRMLRAWQQRQYEKAADEALDSEWAIQVGNRSKDIAHMIKHNELPEGLQ